MRRAILGVVALAASAGVLTAAARPYPAEPAVLAGTWSYDPAVSTDADQIEHALLRATGEIDPEALADLSRQGMVVIEPGTRQGAGGLRPGSRAMTDAQRRVFTALTDAVRFPPTTLAIAVDDDTVMMTAAGISTALRTGGKADVLPVAGSRVRRSATWDGATLAVTYSAGDAGTYAYGYAVAPKSGQLVVRFTFDGGAGRWPTVTAKVVYDREE